MAQALFDQLADEYEFSSEELRAIVGKRLLRPLANCLILVQNHTLGGCTTEELGLHFDQGLANAPDLATLTDGEVMRELDVLRRVHEDSDYVRWVLIETTAIYLKALLWRSSGVGAAQVGRLLAEAFDEWAGRIPLVGMWKTLSRYAIAEELAFLKKVLLRSPRARQRFGMRLGDLFRSDEKVLGLLREAGFLPHGWKS
jgi:hypothetical protein